MRVETETGEVLYGDPQGYTRGEISKLINVLNKITEKRSL